MFKKTLLWLAILIGFVGTQAKSQTFENGKIDVLAGSSTFYLNCVYYKPANFSTTKKYPLVLFFHGMGEAGTDINKMYNTGLPKILKDGYKPAFDFIMVAPQHNSYSLDPKHLEQVLNESLIKFPNVDQSRIYLTGLSAGGNTIYVSSLNINKELPKRFAAMVVMSGATQGINKDNFPWWKEFKTPLWAVVGQNDPSYVGQNQYVVDQVNAQVPGLASITIRPGIGHGGWNDVYNGTVKTKDGKNMWQWLYQFTRGTTTAPSGSTQPVNALPVANAGADKSITLPTSSVQLTGSGTDADGSIASYSWTKIAGPSSFTFSSTTVSSPTVSNLIQGTYTFRLTVKDNSGATATDDVNVIVNGTTTSPTTTGKTIMVNLFGGSNAYTSTQWNNWNTYSSLTISSLKYSDGTSSAVKASINVQNSVSDNGSTYSTTMAPKEVGRYASYSTSNRTLTISGLDNSKTYTLELYASRSGVSNNTTRFTVGSSSVDIKTDNNLDQKAVFTVTPVNGTITVNLAKLNTYNYLNGFVLKS
jgi:poly(3-hydroxybutyrate) depolymerase